MQRFRTQDGTPPSGWEESVMQVLSIDVIENDRPAMADKGLKGGSLGLVAVIVIGGRVDSARLQPRGQRRLRHRRGRHEKAPFIMLFAFVPMGASPPAFYYLNKADPDCGTNFTWGVRAFGPKAGWIAGWGCIVADLVIMPNLAGIRASTSSCCSARAPPTTSGSPRSSASCSSPR